jgi:hypothetical protein
MHLLSYNTHTIIKNSNLKIKHQNMFKYPKSANSLEKDVAAAASSSTSIGREFQVQHFMYFMEN